MTDEERRKQLCERLRSTWSTVEEQIKAADEIERLAAITQSDAVPVVWREALDQQLSDLVESARDTRSDKGGAAQWTHPIGALVSEFAKRIAAPPCPDASAELVEKVAKAICSVRYNDPEKRMPICEENSDGPPIWTSFTQHARAAIEAMHPDTSAGLIEAAEIAEEWDSGWGEDRNTRVARQTAIEIAEAIRNRATDRSGK